MARNKIEAVAYLRTSSAANVGTDKDSDKRQRAAIQSFAKTAGYTLVAEFYDAAVSGADPIETRAGFAELLDKIEGNGVRVVIVEDASRFARELMTQELGILALIQRGVRVLTANGDDLTDIDRSKSQNDAADRRRLPRIREGEIGRQAEGGTGPQARRDWQVRRPQELGADRS